VPAQSGIQDTLCTLETDLEGGVTLEFQLVDPEHCSECKVHE